MEKTEKKKVNLDEGLKRIGIAIGILFGSPFIIGGLFFPFIHMYELSIGQVIGQSLLIILGGIIIFFTIVGIFWLIRWVLKGFQK